MTTEQEVLAESFLTELQKIAARKEAGFVDSLKSLALKDVGGPPGFIQPLLEGAAPVAKKTGKGFAEFQKAYRSSHPAAMPGRVSSTGVH